LWYLYISKIFIKIQFLHSTTRTFATKRS